LRVGYVGARAQGRDGWGRYTVEVVRAARWRGIEPVLVLADPEVDARLTDVECHAILPPPLGRRFTVPRSLSAARRLRPILATCDVVHCLVEPYAPLVALSVPPRVPLVMTAHGSWAVRPLRSLVRRWLFRAALRRVDLLVFQSRFTRDKMAGLAPPTPHILAPAGVDPADFQPARRASLPPWAGENPIVLSVGALKPRKGYEVALEAVSLASREFPDLHYVVVGEGESGDHAGRLRRQAEELGVGERFHLLGSVASDELIAWYLRADVFLLLPVNVGGSFEGLGLAYLEAAAAGRPCIGTRDCGAAEAVIDGETGLLVPQGDAVAAADSLIRLLESRELRMRLGEAGRRRVDGFTWARLAERLRESYAELLREESPSPGG
jgi:phosphatidylinositol alpha-1,6-mannosyltransferase